MSTFLANLDLAISRPEKTSETLKDQKLFKIFILIIAFFSVIVWFEIGVDFKRTPILDLFDSSNWDILFNGIEPGTGWYSILFVALECIYYVLTAFIPSLAFFSSLNTRKVTITKKTEIKKIKPKGFTAILTDLLVANGIRLPFFYAIACIPMLTLNEAPFSSSEGFIYSLFWILGGIFANASIWQTTGRIAGNYYLSFKKGLALSFFSTIIGLGIVWGTYFLGGFS